MKRLTNNILKLCALSFVLFLASCGDDEETKVAIPTISVTMSDGAQGVITDGGNVEVGDTVTFNISITAAGGFNVYRVSGNLEGEKTRTDLGVDAGATTATDKFFVPFKDAPVGTTQTFDFVAIDDANQSSNVTSISVNIVSPSAKTFTAVMLAAPLGDLSGTSFFSTNTGLTYSPAAVNATNDPVSNEIDFGYYYGANDMASIASPAGFAGTVFSGQVDAWGTKNSTTLKATALTAATFIEVKSSADIETAYAAGTDGTEFKTGLSVGDVLAFETNSTKTNSPGKKGLILVKAINGTDGQNDNIEIEVTVQQ
jgi:hypothetical protein